jgi:Mn-dependent DtxR family transcriptional regulator
MSGHNHTWKEFKANEVSHSMAHYLVTLRDLHALRGYARVSDVAKELGIAKGTASVQMRHLKEKGFVTEDENRHLLLSEAGDTIARQVVYNRSTLIQFLSNVLEVDPHQAELDACKIEHLLSPEAGHQLLALVQLLLSEDEAAAALLGKLKSAKGRAADSTERDTVEEREPAAAAAPSGSGARNSGDTP